MSILSEALVFVFVSLVVINGLLGGGVADAIGTFATDEEKQVAREDIMCGIGYLLWTPTTDVYGIDFPAPSYTNIVVAALLSLSIILIIRITTAVEWSFKYSVLTFIAVWLGVKLLGYILLSMSSDTCMVWAEEMMSKTSGFYDVAAAGGAVWGLKIVWGMRK